MARDRLAIPVPLRPRAATAYLACRQQAYDSSAPRPLEPSPPMSKKARRAGRRPARLFATSAFLALVASLLTGAASPAHAAGESVNIWLTTTDDSGGRHVTRGLQQQTPIAFGTGGSGAQNITVNENTRYQQFTGAGASFTDTAAWLMNSSGALSSATRTQVMQQLFDPNSRHRPGLPPQPDGRLRPGPEQLLLRRHAGRPDRPEPQPLLHRPRPGRRAAAHQAGPAAQPGAQGHGHAVERPGRG